MVGAGETTELWNFQVIFFYENDQANAGQFKFKVICTDQKIKL